MIREYWRKTVTITGLLLACWLVLTVLVAYFAAELHEIAFARYLGAQGALLLYVVLVGLYVWYLKKQDRRYGAREGGE